MPLHAIPVAIVTAKILGSAVVSLSPAAMQQQQQCEEGEGGEPTPPRTSVKDLFKADFYKREFERLGNESCVPETTAAAAATAPVIIVPAAAQRQQQQRARPSRRFLSMKSLQSLASERSVPIPKTSNRCVVMKDHSVQSLASSSSSGSSSKYSTIHDIKKQQLLQHDDDDDDDDDDELVMMTNIQRRTHRGSQGSVPIW